MPKLGSAIVAALSVNHVDHIVREFKVASASAKSAKASKKEADGHVFAAYCHNFCLMAEENLFDPRYGEADYRNTTTGPAYRNRLESAGLSEAKAKLLWELGNLGYTMIEGLKDLLDGDKASVKTVATLLKKSDLETESALKKFLQPSNKTVEEMVHKMTSKLDDAEFERVMLAVIAMRQADAEKAAAEAAAEAAKAPAKPEAEEAKAA